MELLGRVGLQAAVPTVGVVPAGVVATSDGDGGGGWVLPVVLVGGAIVLGLVLWSSWRRRAATAARAEAEEADRQRLKADVSILADDLVRLEPEIQRHPDAQHDFDAAVSRNRAAQAALEYTDQPVDLIRVARVIAEGRYSLERARAITEGRQPPLPPEELQRPGMRGEPAVTLDADRQPAYVGYPGAFQGGWFGGTGGLFGGLLLGSILYGGFGGWGNGGTAGIDEGGDQSDGDAGDTGAGDAGSGDAGGGDAGGDFGGDYGGGDFGGGDFGGGDFGGGDFGGG